VPITVAANILCLTLSVQKCSADVHGQLLKSGSCLCLLPKHAVQHLKHPYHSIFYWPQGLVFNIRTNTPPFPTTTMYFCTYQHLLAQHAPLPSDFCIWRHPPPLNFLSRTRLYDFMSTNSLITSLNCHDHAQPIHCWPSVLQSSRMSEFMCFLMPRWMGPCDAEDIKALLEVHMSVSEVNLDRLAPPGR